LGDSLSAFPGQTDFEIQETTLEQFARPFGGGKVQIARSDSCVQQFTMKERVMRARSKQGNRNFHYAWNNCEHFVNWVCIDKSASHQIENVCTTGIIACYATAAVAIAVAVLQLGNTNGQIQDKKNGADTK